MFKQIFQGLRSVLSKPQRQNPSKGLTTKHRRFLELETLEERAVPTMTPISNTTAEPFRWIADIDRDTGSGHSNCSGALVSPYHIITAAHCVHTGGGGTSNFRDKSDYTVYLGRDGDEFPYGVAKVTKMRALKGWINDDKSDYDMALLTLDRRVGDYTGYFSMAALSKSELENSKLNLAGYPSEGSAFNGDDLIHSYGPVDEVSDYKIYYKPSEGLEGVGGHSGAPVWLSKNGQRQLVGVHRGSGSTRDNATRLTSARLNTWRNAIASDSSPANKPALMDYDEWFDRNTSSVSSTSVAHGNSFTVSARVFNGGTARGNSVKVNFYASTNDTITKSDYLIGTKYIDVSQYSYSTATWTGSMPSNIPAGSYYIGWEIDPDNTISEFSDGSNDGMYRNKVTISQSKNPATATLISPGGTIADTTPTFRWNSANNASWYQVYVQNVSTGQKAFSTWVQSTSYTPTTDMAEGNYRFWVQTYGNDVYGDWSTSKDFTIQVPKPASTTPTGPGGTISDATPTFRWNSVSNVSWYQVYVQNVSTGQKAFSTWVQTTSYTPTADMAEGNYRFWVQTYGNGKYGDWSNSKDFTIRVPKPAATTLIGPGGTLSDATPTFRWNSVSNASWYQLYVLNVTTGQKAFSTWVQSTSYTPTTAMADGNYRYWVQTYGNGKYGDWSSSKDFTLQIPKPDTAVLIGPNGSTTDKTPTFRWNSARNAVWYNIYIYNKDTGLEINQWVQTTSYTHASSLPSGNYSFWVRTWGNGKLGDWSSALTFRLV